VQRFQGNKFLLRRHKEAIVFNLRPTGNFDKLSGKFTFFKPWRQLCHKVNATVLDLVRYQCYKLVFFYMMSAEINGTSLEINRSLSINKATKSMNMSELFVTLPH